MTLLHKKSGLQAEKTIESYKLQVCHWKLKPEQC